MMALCLAAGVALAQYGKPAQEKARTPAAKPDFEITASYIEACSCDMFCPCYFNDHATAHGNVVVEVAGDRKSTRLNSSHGYISYAVFCLKKKKKTAAHDEQIVCSDGAVS